MIPAFPCLQCGGYHAMSAAAAEGRAMQPVQLCPKTGKPTTQEPGNGGEPRYGSVKVNCNTHGLYWSDPGGACPMCVQSALKSAGRG